MRLRGKFRQGGRIPGDGKPTPVLLAKGYQITTPEQAEQVGLTADARRMRRERGE